ncbi:MAG: hypothetical protein APF84_17905 [Gracilibacter sp. BRH_c7a]|nr:MAG: hypothetical protein APF84_17905 [Gracilibacter sp. BRH_c7a]
MTAYNIWNTLRARYGSIETFQMYKNFIHDRDFDLLLNQFLSTFLKEVKILEEEAARYSVTLPKRPAADIKIDKKIDELTDRFIYRKIFEDLVTEMYALARAYRTSTTNDSMRDLFKDALLGHASQFQVLYKYGKLKSWEDNPPAYKPPKPMEKEDLSVSETFHIWDHLNFRYDQLELTQFYVSFAHDTSFIAALEMGIKLLKKQIELFEQMSLKFNVPVPERPPAKIVQRVDPEAMEDHFMYRVLLSGIQDAVDLHMRAVLETVRNDHLREVFIDLFKTEMNAYDKFLKYGKAKGWTKVPPMYGELV